MIQDDDEGISKSIREGGVVPLVVGPWISAADLLRCMIKQSFKANLVLPNHTFGLCLHHSHSLILSLVSSLSVILPLPSPFCPQSLLPR